MISRILTIVLELFLASAATATVIRRYQDYPLPECPIEAVCSEIYSLAALNLSPSFINSVTCKCPSGGYCPTEPGPQTLSVDFEKWYGLCSPVDDIPQCENGEIAEDLYVSARGFGGKNVTKIHCTCPRHGAAAATGTWGDKVATVFAGSSSDSANAKVIHHFVCSEDYMSKRGRFGETSRGRNRGRFYFYRK